jgi:hypothetical protein
VAGFIDRLTPADRVAVVGFGQGSPVTLFLSDFQKARETIASARSVRLRARVFASGSRSPR